MIPWLIDQEDKGMIMKKFLILLSATSSIIAMEPPLTPRTRELNELRATVARLEARVQVGENFVLENIADLELQQGYQQDRIRDVQARQDRQEATSFNHEIRMQEMRFRNQQADTETAALKNQVAELKKSNSWLQYSICGLAIVSASVGAYLFYKDQEHDKQNAQTKKNLKDVKDQLAALQKAHEIQQESVAEALKKINRTIPKVKELQDNQPKITHRGTLIIPATDSSGDPLADAHIKKHRGVFGSFVGLSLKNFQQMPTQGQKK